MTRVLMNYVANPPSSERQRDQGKDQGCVPQAHGLASLTNKMCEATLYCTATAIVGFSGFRWVLVGQNRPEVRLVLGYF